MFSHCEEAVSTSPNSTWGITLGELLDVDRLWFLGIPDELGVTGA
jgi:hypothetical protein